MYEDSPARQVAISRRLCCVEDIDLLQEIIALDGPVITVIIGAGSGTMSLGFLEVRGSHQWLTSVDISQEALDWERKAWVAGEWGEWPKRVSQLCCDSSKADWTTLARIDCLIIDGDHSEEGVRKDLESWLPRMSEHNAVIMLHDYDATNAPEFYPGVKVAADEILVDWQFRGKQGWSAWWTRR